MSRHSANTRGPSLTLNSTTPSPIPFSAKPSKSLFSTLIPPKPLKLRPIIHLCSRKDGYLKLSHESSGFDDDYYRESDTPFDGGAESVSGDEVCIEITNTGKNSRRVVARIEIDANLDVIWGILTDYEKLADFIPGLAVSRLMEKKQNFARLYQIGEQNLAWGLKFNAKGIVDCFEKELETFPLGRIRRDIEFNMIEGDFQVFQGKWSIEQKELEAFPGRIRRDIEFNMIEGDFQVFQGKWSIEQRRDFESVLCYVVDVKPKLLLPVQLVEGRLCREIQTNLICIREEARKAMLLTL